MIDTHAHLEACADPAHEVVERARAAGVARILAVGTTIESCRGALAVAEAEEGVFAILGIHPHEAEREGDRLDELRELLAHPRAVAVGETGLDFYRDHAPRDRQAAVFEAELDLAAELGKPVVIHTRAADDDTATDARALRRHGRPALLLVAGAAPGRARARATTSRSPATSRSRTPSELRLAATQVPADRILAETDSPYLAPQPVRGRPNEPAYVMHTLAALAAARGDDPAELEARIDANAAAAFGL